MSYDKSHIPAIADDVVNGRIDESSALSLFSEDLQRILKVEIGKRLRNRGYDRDNIGNTTDKGIPYLADDIVLGLVSEEVAFKNLFKDFHKQLTNEISKRREDEILWNHALASQTIEMFEKYLDTYNNPDSTYVGRYVSHAEEIIQHIESDDKEWIEAKSLDTESAYLHYLAKYDVHSPAYRGKYVDDAKEAILSLTPPPTPEPRIKDDESWANATKLNTIEAYQEYLRGYGHASTDGYTGAHIKEAEWAIRHIIDEDAWAKAQSINTIESYQEYKDICRANNYPGYNWVHYNAANTHIGNLQKAEDVRLQKEADNADWSNALKENTIDEYRRYLSLHNAGIHKKEALDAIAKLEKQAFVNQENIDWQSASKTNTLSAYKSFVAKYSEPSLKYKAAHLDAANQKIAELTAPAPVPAPIKWWKWIGIAIVLVLAWLTYVQWHDCAWPFNIKANDDDSSPIIEDVEHIDSLQWAIDNKAIPLLTKYAEMDSTRAYYPLALALNAQDSVANIEKTLHWLDIVLDPDVNSLHQNIINDIQEKELNVLASRFNDINPNEKDADRKYLEVYTDYVCHFERLATHTPRKKVQYMPIEDMANAQIADRKKHEELRTSILREWEIQQSRLRNILSNIDDNAKIAYSNNQ